VGALLIAVLGVPLAAVVLTRVVGGIALRRRPKQRAALERHWLWAIVPATAVYLAAIGAWLVAVLWLAVSPLAVLLLKRSGYFGAAAGSSNGTGHS
jgi:hypothetical protein